MPRCPWQGDALLVKLVTLAYHRVVQTVAFEVNQVVGPGAHFHRHKTAYLRMTTLQEGVRGGDLC
jgi:hypothetical protein